MMKKLIALCSFVFLLCSCAGVNVKQPDIGNVKKVAILSDNVNNEELKDALITDPRLTKFNKLKKSNSEAFYYWFKVAELMDDKGN